MTHVSRMPGSRAILAFAFALAALVAFPATGQAKNGTITFEATKKDLFFDGSKQVSSGGTLRLINNTNPKKVGPHTFSIVQRRLVPEGREEVKHCFDPGNVCRDIATAHKVNFETGEVGKPDVDRGAVGWDKAFSSKTFGDSFFTETRDERTMREVVAEPGTALHFICAVHPFMKGKIEVTR